MERKKGHSIYTHNKEENKIFSKFPTSVQEKITVMMKTLNSKYDGTFQNLRDSAGA